MNSTEQGKLFNAIFAYFPSFRTWYQELPTRDQTYAVWSKTLAEVNYIDCLQVLDDWTSGKSKPPAGFEREQTVYKLASAARDIQAERDRWIQNEKILEQADRKKYEPLKFDDSMLAAYTKILSRLDEHKSGGMTDRQWKDWCEQCAKEMK